MSDTVAPKLDESRRLPVSAKGVVIRNGAVALLKNERNEWELPGGKLEPTESPEACVAREIHEELGLQVEAKTYLDTWIYEIGPGATVQIVTYGCTETSLVEASLSHEHSELGWFRLADVANLVMPEGYKRSIATWATMNGHGVAAV